MPAVKFKGGRNGLQPLYNHKNLLMIQNFHLNNKKQSTDNREKKKKISMSLLYVSQPTSVVVKDFISAAVVLRCLLYT